MEELEYDHLITRTSFNFKNEKEEAEYWDTLLIESPIRFKNTFSKYLRERLLVRYSYYKIFQYFFYGMLVLALINPYLVWFNIGFALVFSVLSLVFYWKYRIFGIKVQFTELMHTDDFLEMLRDEVIKIKNNQNV